jgi:putative ABC transport system ATP-binding protein
MTTPVAELTQVCRSFDVGGKAVHVLNNLDLTIGHQDRIVLFGPSGCGKTTLLHLLALLDEPTRGFYHLEGKDISSLTEPEKAACRASRIGLVFQRFHLLPFHTVQENIELRTRYRDGGERDAPEAITTLLEQVGLEDMADRPARLLSGGEQQRVCIARALYVKPSLFLADEPTGNLDRANSAIIKTLFDQAARSTPVVIATHDPDWLDFATRVLRFEDGCLMEDT